MIVSPAEAFVRRCGNPVVYLTLALGMVVNFAGAGLMLCYLAAIALASRFGAVAQSFRNFSREFRQSDSGRMYVIVSALTLAVIFLSVYHGEWGETEVALKRFIIAYVVVNFIWNYSARVVVDAATAGALLAGAIAVAEIFYLGEVRAAGPTNAIRFGMLAALFSAISLAGWIFSVNSRRASILYCAGSLSGLVATTLSGSRGALLGLPFMLLPIVVRLAKGWRWPSFMMLLAYLVAALVLFTSNAGTMKARSEAAITEIKAAITELNEAIDKGGVEAEAIAPVEPAPPPTGQSFRARQMLLEFAFQRFQSDVLFGAGDHAWRQAMEQANSNPDESRHFAADFNQAHNQFANDLAKGGVIRGMLGLLFILAPFFFFLGSRPFVDRQETMPALLGLITCMGFGTFCLTESVLILSLPASIYSMLVFYLVVAKEDRWAKPA